MPISEIDALSAEILRLKKMITALMNRAEREVSARATNFGLFQTTVMLENQIRSRTSELQTALKENEQINRTLQKEVEARERINQALAHEREEQRQLIAQLEETQSQLLQSEKLASIGQLAAGVAHEINNPISFVHSNLGTLQGYVNDLLVLLDGYDEAIKVVGFEERLKSISAMKQKVDLDFLRQDALSLIAESTEGTGRVRRIVQDLRDFSRPGDSEWQLADLHAGLESTLNVVWNEIKYKADVVREYGELPEIECLPFQINQVFLNLLVNAAHAISEHGCITLRTSWDGQWARVAICDTGSGIPPEILSRIFDPFFTTKPIGKGTGLGLSVAYGIMAKHGGFIDVESTVGVGTTFTVRLPNLHRAEVQKPAQS
jgi:two-component system, NtrC family, sensor kinase